MPRTHVPIVLSVFAAWLLEGALTHGQEATPADWPHLRGPNLDAVSLQKGIHDSWPVDGPRVLWSRELGQGYSGFVVVGGRAFTQFQNRLAQYATCLDAQTGKEIWRQRIDWPWEPTGPYPGPYATPAWHAGRLYYATTNGLIGCLDAASGRKRWVVDTRQRFQGKGTDFGYAATPLVEDGKVIIPVGGKDASVVALDALDGLTIWAAGSDEASYCPIYPITLNGRRLAIAFLQNSLVAHDLATGKIVWREELSRHYDEHSAWPLYSSPYLLVSAPFRAGSRLYRLDRKDKDGGIETVWENKQLSNDVCSSVLIEGHVYGFDLHQAQASAHRTSRGRFKCLEFATGKVRWQTTEVGHATVLAADGKLILLNDTGTLILARANPSAYQELARYKVFADEDGLCWTPPTLWRGLLFLRNHARATCLVVAPREEGDSGAQTSELPRATAFDWSDLLSREPRSPEDAPSLDELALWFAWCMGIFGASAIAAVGAVLILRFLHSGRPPFWGSLVFATTAFLFGLLGTTFASAWADTFILTWPASLYVAFRVTIGVVVWVEARPREARPRWVSRVVTLAFLGCCGGYYWACQSVGYLMGLGFLAGFLPAASAPIVAARTRNWWQRGIADVVGFTAYFWISGLLPGWKDHWVGG
jgi:outer membrane protein assembly factor BamB